VVGAEGLEPPTLAL